MSWPSPLGQDDMDIGRLPATAEDPRALGHFHMGNGPKSKFPTQFCCGLPHNSLPQSTLA